MNARTPIRIQFDELILRQGQEISRRLNQLRKETFPPDAHKMLRQFSMAEAAYFLGVSPSNLKKLHLEGRGPQPAVQANGRRSYTAGQIGDLRRYLAENGRSEAKKYLPGRRAGDKLQVIAVVNFKGGSGKTTTAAHLAQHLALHGYRVLAIDLDPQASLSALYGVQPELDNNPSIYEALRYEGERKPVKDIILPTKFPGLDLIPAALDLQEYEYDTPLALQDKSNQEGKMFWNRLEKALAEVEPGYDAVIIDCPPQLGYLTLTALAAASAVLITVHPQMLDLMSMSQFLLMMGEILKTIRNAGAPVELDWLKYLITRYEPADIPQTQMLGFMQSMLAGQMLKSPMLKTTAISDASLTKQTLYEIDRSTMNRETYERALGALEAVNSEVRELIHQSWGRGRLVRAAD
jgi:chromosome partitioning protein